MVELFSVKDTYNVVCDASHKVYLGLSVVFPFLPGWVMERRAEGVINLSKAAQKKLDEAGLSKEQYRQCSLKLELPLIENASLEDEPTLQDIWANLLANALNPDFKEELRTSFVSIIKDLSTTDVLILQKLDAQPKRKTALPASKVISGFGRASYFADEIGIAKSDAEISIQNLSRLGLVGATQEIYVPQTNTFGEVDVKDADVGEAGASGVGKTKLRVKTNPGLAKSFPYLTDLGRAFVRACVIDAGKRCAEPAEGHKGVDEQKQTKAK